MRAAQIAWTDPLSGHGDPTDDGQTTVMLFAGRPIGESVYASGPFAMNTRAEIEQAYRDFHAGAFGSIPRHTRLPSSA